MRKEDASLNMENQEGSVSFLIFMLLNKVESLHEQFVALSLSIQPNDRQCDVIRCIQ